MRVDRRQFIQAGAVAVFAGAGCSRSSSKSAPPSTAPPIVPSNATGASLAINFEGLYLIERKGTTMIVHLIDGPAVGLPAHIPQMKALAATIDQTKTAKPDPAHVISAGNDVFWLWDLKGVDVTGPAGAAGANDLTADQSSNEDNLALPSDGAGWQSMARVPDLRVLLGATRITKYDAFTSSVTLTHGHLAVLKPTDPAGVQTVWVFTNPSTNNVIMRRALTNKVSYSCPMNGAEVTVYVGGKPIVFKAGTTPQVSLTNMPVSTMPCGNPCTPHMDHFGAFAKLVDAQFTPTVAAAAPFSPVQGQEAGADYCPGGSI